MWTNILLLCIFCSVVFAVQYDPSHNNRPPVNRRRFTSPVIEKVINNIATRMVDPDLALLFVDCFPNTLDTTVNFTMLNGQPDTFVITGDIPAMWLRDSSGQVLPYVQFANQDDHLKQMLRGVIRRQAFNINIDVYANAFNIGPSGSPWDRDSRHPAMTPWLWEGKYELDSIAWVVHLSSYYYSVTSDTSICTSEWFTAMNKVVDAMTYQQTATSAMHSSDPLFYSFARQTNSQIDTLLQPLGVPNKQCGLVRGGFRPSDDAQRLPYQVASNALASAALSNLAKMVATGACSNAALAAKASSLSAQIRTAIETNAVVKHPVFGSIYGYEADGFGSILYMDDANVPSIAALPLFGYVAQDDPTYVNTRKFLYSEWNPYYFKGSYGSGIGSPHTGMGRIWHMSLIVQAMTSNNDTEILELLKILKTTTASTYFMHESFDVNNPNDYTRSWFAWANSMFGDLIVYLAQYKQHLIYGPN